MAAGAPKACAGGDIRGTCPFVVTLADAWEANADEWIAWARRPGHDGFWSGTWPELSAVLPSPDGMTIEIGCGEGRVCRQLMERGHSVLGIERSPTLARAAMSADPPVPLVRADAAKLPVRDGSTMLVVACMVLQDVDDLDGTVGEIARVLRIGGSLCLAIVHPFSTAADLDSYRSERPLTVTRPYLVERRYSLRDEREGLAMTFVSAHRPLSRYLEALASVGIVVTAMREYGEGPVPWLLVCRAARIGSEG